MGSKRADESGSVAPAEGGSSGKSRKTTIPVVGIGASADAVQAVTELLRELSPDAGFAYVVVFHGDPHREQEFRDALAKATSLPVVSVRSGEPPVENHIYLAPNHVQVSLDANGCLQCAEPKDSEGHNPIDTLFTSLASTLGSNTVGVLLLGVGRDGVEGMEKIKGVGGITMAQNAKSARYGAIAKSPLPPGQVDFILSPRDIARELARLGKSLALRDIEYELRWDGVGERAVGRILNFVREATGVDFSHYKRPTLLRRLQRRISITDAGSPEAYFEVLKSNPLEVSTLYRDFLITVTSFFRDPETFDALRTNFFPKIAEGKSPQNPIRAWVPGCSTGEEVYTLAILLLEFLGERAAHIPIQIFGTDLSEEAIERARTGVYPERIAAEVSPERLKRFFVKVDNGYQISKTIRESCVFARHNLTADPPLAKMDLISCRNLLIYFGPVLQQKVIPLLHYALRPAGGYLLLGKSEVIDLFSDLFVCSDKIHRIFAKKSAVVKVPIEFSAGVRIPTRPHTRDLPALSPVRDAEVDLKREVDRLIVANFSPSGVVINENMDVLQFRGDTSLFISPNSGRASLNLAKIVHQDLLTELKSALDESRTNGGIQIVRRGIPLRQADALVSVNLRVAPIREANLRGKYYFIVFEKAQAPWTDSATLSEEAAANEARRLYEELQATRRYLQSVIDDREATTEELQSANEEIISANEELQTVNQELEASKEELESSNEELTTVNEELSNRVEELRQSEERFRILVSGVKDYAIFMLDPKGFVTTWNAGAERIKGYTAEEIIGRHFSCFYTPEAIRANHPAHELEIAIREGRYEEEGIRLRKDDLEFLANVVITALFDSKGNLQGFAKVTRDITERKRIQRLEAEKEAAEIASRAKSAFLANMSHEIRTPLTAIVGFAEFLEQDSGVMPETVEYIEAIKRNARHLSSLVSEILDLSKVEANQMIVERVPVRLDREIHTVISMLRIKAKEKGLEVRLKYATPIPETIMTDPTRLKQILVNIVGNSIKFSDKGAITITVSLREPRENGGKYQVVFSVSDNGCGIPFDKQNRIFEPFEQATTATSRHHGGTGLGLSLSRELARLLGGNIVLKHSQPNKGSTFEITIDPGRLDRIPIRLPRAEYPPGEAPPLPQPAQPLAGIRVLLVEDTLDSQALFQRILEGAGAEVEIANDGEEGVRKAMDGNFDVILMDMKMPVLDGHGATVKLRQNHISTPIIAFTAHATQEERDRSLNAGCNDYHGKPISSKTLCKVVAEWAGKRIPV